MGQGKTVGAILSQLHATERSIQQIDLSRNYDATQLVGTRWEFMVYLNPDSNVGEKSGSEKDPSAGGAGGAAAASAH
jgi:hypothetical protein